MNAALWISIAMNFGALWTLHHNYKVHVYNNNIIERLADQVFRRDIIIKEMSAMAKELQEDDKAIRQRSESELIIRRQAD